MDSFWDRLARFFNLGPLWLALYLIAAAFATNVHYAWMILIFPHEDVPAFGISPSSSTQARVAGIVIITVSTVMKTMFLGSWGYALWLTWFRATRWRPKVRDRSPAIAQASEIVFAAHLGPGVLPEQVRLEWHEGDPFRKCFKPGCKNGRQGTTDRCYHSSRLNRCLPCYDHYCPWIQVAVYLNTLKPYMALQVWLLFDVIFSVAVSIKALVDAPAFVVPHVVSLILAAIVIGLLAVNNWQGQFVTEILRNETGIERKMRTSPSSRFGRFDPRLVAFKVAKNRNEAFQLRLKHFPDRSPWDYGFLENCRHTLGPFWQWLLFWIQPDRVRYYQKYGRFRDFNEDVDRYHSSLRQLTGVSIDGGALPANRAGGAARRRENRSGSAVSGGSSSSRARGAARRSDRSSSEQSAVPSLGHTGGDSVAEV
ncbi:hypothetical protein GGR57DRAFT_497997 [Xylariaceae sp. FL1272]|nr:hypothetical protein GGR57DRAFT_497997 [Xylariaceae sp. FL1272]